MPDIDIDFCIEGRQSVIDYIKTRYGDESVSQIITFGRMKAKSVLRDVGRVLDMPYDQVDRIAKLIPDDLKITLDKALASQPKSSEMKKAINSYRKSFYGRVESVLSRAQLLSTYHHIKGQADYLGDDLARYTNLTADDIHKAAQKWLTKPHLRIDVLPVEKAEKVEPKGQPK